MATKDMDEKIAIDGHKAAASSDSGDSVEIVDSPVVEPHHLRRTLRGKEVQLFAIAGAIGTGKITC